MKQIFSYLLEYVFLPLVFLVTLYRGVHTYFGGSSALSWAMLGLVLFLGCVVCALLVAFAPKSLVGPLSAIGLALMPLIAVFEYPDSNRGMLFLVILGFISIPSFCLGFLGFQVLGLDENFLRNYPIVRVLTRRRHLKLPLVCI